MPPPRGSPKAPTKIDPHLTDSLLEISIRNLESGDRGVSPEAVEAILGFVEATRGTVSTSRTLGYVRDLSRTAIVLGPEFLEPTEQTPERFRRKYAEQGYAGNTILTDGSTARMFWRWKFKKDFRVKVSPKLLAHKDETSVLTPEEVARIVAACNTVRDKAFVAVTYESGARISEVLGLHVGDVEPTEYGGFRLRVEGKTGRRTIPLFEASVAHLSLYLRDYPFAKDPSAPLWTNERHHDRVGLPMRYGAWVRVLQRAARRAGISKVVTPHILRHSRASAVAKNPNVSTSVLESLFGWKHGSPMAATYVHLTGRDVEDAMARAQGVTKIAPVAPVSSLPKTCGRCSRINTADSKFCSGCAGPLSLEAVESQETALADARQLAKLLDRPEIRKLLARELAKAGPV
jgi:integrase/recombinase XerD